MKDRKKIIKRAAVAVALFVLLMMCFSFLATGSKFSSSSEAVEAIYGRADFGGRYSWMGNVKRAGGSTPSLIGNSLAFDIDNDEAIDDLTNPDDGLNPLALALPSAQISAYQSFSDGSSPDNLVKVEQIHLGEIPIFGGSGNGDDDYRGYFNPVKDSNDFGGDDDDNDGYDDTVVVPAPAAALLAAIGIMVVSAVKKR